MIPINSKFYLTGFGHSFGESARDQEPFEESASDVHWKSFGNSIRFGK